MPTEQTDPAGLPGGPPALGLCPIGGLPDCGVYRVLRLAVALHLLDEHEQSLVFAIGKS